MKFAAKHPISFTAYSTSWQLLGGGIVLTGCLGIVRDYAQSIANGFHFYLSESALFNVYWLLFIPLLWMGRPVMEKIFPVFAVVLSYRKIIVFVLSAAILHIFLYALVVWLLSLFFLNHRYAILSTVRYSAAEDLFKYLLVYGFAGWVWFRHTEQAVPAIQGQLVSASVSYLSHLMIRNGRKTLVIPLADILFIKASSPYITIHTGNDKHFHLQSLTAVQTLLDPSVFIRVHKGSIVNLQKVIRFTSRLNGDYDLILLEGSQVRLSRNYAKAFKEKFTPVSTG